MKDLMERQMYEVVIQAAANNKVVARETIKAYRKNVTAKCYGEEKPLPPPTNTIKEEVPRDS